MDRFAAFCVPRNTPYIVRHADQTMVPTTAEDLDNCMLVNADANVLAPAITPYVIMPDSKVRETDGPCQPWIVTRDDAGYLPSEVDVGSFDEAERACDAADARMGSSREEAHRIILAPIAGGAA